MLEELCCGVGAEFIKGLQIAKAAILVQESKLIEFLSLGFANQTGGGNIFDINLHPLAWICHFFVRFLDILRIWKLHSHTTDSAQDTVKSGDGSGVAALAQFNPEHHQAGVGVSAAHILNQLQFPICVLFWMAVRPVRAVSEGLNRTVILFAPTIDVLPGGLIADGGFGNAVFQRIFNSRLLKAHILCYLIHGG